MVLLNLLDSRGKEMGLIIHIPYALVILKHYYLVVFLYIILDILQLLVENNVVLHPHTIYKLELEVLFNFLTVGLSNDLITIRFQTVYS